jgi:hypothetical protein
MKLAKATALQSLNQNRITEKALSRKNSSSAHNQIVPFKTIWRWDDGFQNNTQLNEMREDCRKLDNNAELTPCDSERNIEYLDALFNGESFPYPMCCDDKDKVHNVKNARSAR